MTSHPSSEKESISRRDVLTVAGGIGVAGLAMVGTANAQAEKKVHQLSAEQRRLFNDIETLGIAYVMEGGILQKKTIYKAKSMAALAPGWTQIACSAKGWNHLPMPANLGTDVAVFVSGIGWSNGVGTFYTTLGPPGSPSGIRMGISGADGVDLTGIDEGSAQRYFGFVQGGTIATVVNDYPSEDNEGGYILNFKSRV